MKTKNILTKSISFLLGVFFISGITFAAIWTVDTFYIPDKSERDIITADEFNHIVNTLQNIYNDNDNERIGINQSNPQETLDINGDITVNNILNKDGNYATLGCSTLGTDNTGNLKCNSIYHWTYSGWGVCTGACGTGTKTRTVVNCKRDDDQIVDNSYCIALPKILSTTCPHPCPVNAKWGPWQNYDSCKYYIKGVLGAPSTGYWQSQVSYCTNGYNGGTSCSCDTAPSDAAVCENNSSAYKFSSTCAVQPQIGTWSQWYGPLYTNNGIRYRVRSCSVGNSCPGEAIQFY